jgi:hypothetical protein
MTVVRRGVVITVEGFVGAIVTVTAGCAGGSDSEHPEVKMRRRVIRRSTGIVFIDAGRSFPYNKMMAHLIT